MDQQVIALYRQLLLRTPTPEEVDYWLTIVMQSGVDAAAQQIAGSEEGVRVQQIDLPVIALYQGLLGRAPEPGGFEFWTDMIASDEATFADFIASFTLSAEFADLNPQVALPPDPASLVELFYRNLLGREADAAGLEFWAELLEDGAVTPVTFVSAFVLTDEGQAKLGSAIRAFYLDARDGAIDSPSNLGSLLENTPDSSVPGEPSDPDDQDPPDNEGSPSDDQDPLDDEGSPGDDQDQPDREDEQAPPDDNQAPQLNLLHVAPETSVFFGSNASISTGNAFFDPDLDALAFTAANLPAGLSIDSQTGLITGIPDGSNTPGEVLVTITATDPSGALVSTDRSITVVDPVVDAADDAYTVQAFNSVSGNLGDNDALERVGGVALQEYVFLQPADALYAGPAYGDLTLDPDGSFTYTPNGNIVGTDRFGYLVRGPDGDESVAIATVTIEPSGGAEVAYPVALGNVDPTALLVFDEASGRPTGVDGVELRLDTFIVSGSATGDPDDIVANFELFPPTPNTIDGGSGDGPVELFDPGGGTLFREGLDETSVTVEGDNFVVSIDPSYFIGEDPIGFAFHYGYEGASTVNAPDPVLDPAGSTPIPLIPQGTNSTAAISFTSDFEIIDRRPIVPDVGGTNFLDGGDGEDGLLGMFIDDLVDLDLELLKDAIINDETGNYFQANAMVGAAYDLLAGSLKLLMETEQDFPRYVRFSGSDGDDVNESVADLDASARNNVIFGADSADAGAGGNGGDGSDGAPGFVITGFAGTFLEYDGESGVNGGDGGKGGDSLYSLEGDIGKDVVVGGAGGNAGDQGAKGIDGEQGLTVSSNTTSGVTPVTAAGGSRGIGGDGGAGGDALYLIEPGQGDDIIYGGNGGKGGEGVLGGRAAYVISARDGNDIVHGGRGGDGGGGKDGNDDPGGDSIYLIEGGAGDDIIYGGAAGETFDEFITAGSELLGRANYILDGGAGNDFLVIGLPDLDQSPVNQAGKNAAFHIGTNFSTGLATYGRNSGSYEANGGTGNDVIELGWGFSRDLIIDGGSGFDTLVMRHPEMADGGLYSIDFNAAAYDVGYENADYTVSTPAIRDMIGGIEKFAFDGVGGEFSALLSAEAIIAMTTPQPGAGGDFHELFIEGMGDVIVTLTDGDEWVDSGAYEFDGVSYMRYEHSGSNTTLHLSGADMDFI